MQLAAMFDWNGLKFKFFQPSTDFRKIKAIIIRSTNEYELIFSKR